MGNTLKVPSTTPGEILRGGIVVPHHINIYRKRAVRTPAHTCWRAFAPERLSRRGVLRTSRGYALTLG